MFRSPTLEVAPSFAGAASGATREGLGVADDPTKLFRGSALGKVHKGGRIALPPAFRQALADDSNSPYLVLGVHEDLPCLVGLGEGELAREMGQIERLRLSGEADEDLMLNGAPSIFGLLERIAWDRRGRFVLPARLRSRAQIGTAVLIVGAGRRFEIWDFEVARRRGNSALRELAAHYSAAAGPTLKERRSAQA